MRVFYAIIFISVFFLSCGKTTDPIPNVGVNFQGSLLSPQLSPLRGVNVAVNVKGGVAGIVIYHRPDGVYVAYDRCSSYKPENRCAVTIDDNDLTVTDPCSGSMFSLYDNGNPVKAPATQALKSYYVTVNGYDIFVSN